MRSQIMARIVKIKDEEYDKYSMIYDIITGFINKLLVDRKLSEIIHSGEK